MKKTMYNILKKVVVIAVFLTTLSSQAQDAFITQWKTTTANETITLPTTGSGYNYTIDCGSGGLINGSSSQTASNQTGDATCVYATAGTHTITITGDFPHFYGNNQGDIAKLYNISQWGNIAWRSFSNAFYGASNLGSDASLTFASDTPNLSSVTNMSVMFRDASAFNQDIGNWNTANVTDMSFMFRDALAFNQPINNWNTANVTNMSFMFRNADAFNQDIGNWNVSRVTGTSFMFANTDRFNRPINNWNTANVTNMLGMFSFASAFNQDIGNWNTANVTNMSFMFNGASAFNQPIGNWNVESVTNMSNMFVNADNFNQDMVNWEVESVTNMSNMFVNADNFNGDISNWNVESVTNMGDMFRDASAFNQPIGDWNTANVTNMFFMFNRASAFNQPIGQWNVEAVTNMNNMFRGASAFNQDISNWNVGAVTNMSFMFFGARLSSPNYDALLTGWAAQTVTNSVTFSGGNSRYSAVGATGRNLLTGSSNWRITDGGLAGANTLPGGIALDENSLEENNAVGTIIDTLRITAPVVGKSYTLSIGGEDQASFSLLNGNILVIAVVADFETKENYNITIDAIDGDLLGVRVPFMLSVINRFDVAPTDLTLSNATIAENEAVGSFIGMFSVTDADAGDTHTYTVSDETNFQISNDSLFSNAVFDLEAVASYPITLTATDLGGLSTALDITIMVINRFKIAPTDLVLSNATLAENEAVGSFIGMFSVTDADVGDTHTYTVSDDTHFSISNDSLFSNAVFDFEATPSYTITLTATDLGDLSTTLETSITITDVNDAPTAIALSNATLAENEAVGSFIGVLSATDADAGDTHTYTVSDATNFQISNDSLFSKAVFDFEAIASYDITLTTTDMGGLATTLEATIMVTNRFDVAPTDLVLSNATIAENQVMGSFVGFLSVTDADVDDMQTYSILDGTHFSISNDSLLSNAIFDFETSILIYDITLTATDLGGLSTTLDTTITVTDLEFESIPTGLSLSGNTLAENEEVPTFIGTLTTTSSPEIGDRYTYTVSDTTNFQISNDSLLSNVVFDFETTPSYAITLIVTNLSGVFSTLETTITITNVNEAPTDLVLSNATLAENEAAGSFIGILLVTDADAGDEHTYTVSDGINFSISNDSLFSNALFDFEANPSYAIMLTATDLGGLATTLDITIMVINRFDVAPTDLVLSNATIAENEVVGSFIGVLSANDADAGDMLTYTVSDETNFQISNDSLFSNAVFDFETTPSYDITLTATDLGGLFTTLDATITITDVEDTDVDETLGIEDGEEFTLYPNPVVNQLTVALEEVIHSPVVSVYSLVGQLVAASYTLANKQLVLDVSQLAHGTYVLHITHKNGEFKGRFVKE